MTILFCQQKGHVKPACRSNAYGNQRHQGRYSWRSSTGCKHAGSQHAHVHVVEDVSDSDDNKYVTALETHAMDKPPDTNLDESQNQWYTIANGAW